MPDFFDTELFGNIITCNQDYETNKITSTLKILKRIIVIKMLLKI